MDSVFVPCCWCGGSGRLRHPRLSEAFAAVVHGSGTATEVAAAIGISPEGACNLLARLRSLRLVRREKRKRGKGYVWAATVENGTDG